MRTRARRPTVETLDPLQARVRARFRERDPGLPGVVERALREPGRALDPVTRFFMEDKLGHRFEDVRVHTGTDAERAAALLEAAAFTSGNDIVFDSFRYQPETPEGRRLLAHELVHTLQQRGVGAGGLQVGESTHALDDPLEREAETAAEAVALGERVEPSAVTQSAAGARGRISRQAIAALRRQPAEIPDSPEALDALGGQIERLLLSDPADLFGRVTRRLTRLAPGTRRALVAQVSPKLGATAQARLGAIVAELEPGAELVPAAVETPPPELRGAEREIGPPEPAEAVLPEEAEPAEATADIPITWRESSPPELADEPPAQASVPSLAGGENTVEEPPETAPDASPDATVPALAPAETAPSTAPDAPEPEEAAANSAPIDEAEEKTLESLDEAEDEGEEQLSESEREAPAGEALPVPSEVNEEISEGGAAPPPTTASAAAVEPAEEPLSDDGGGPEPPDTEPPIVEEPAEPEEAEESEDTAPADEVVEEAPPADADEDAEPGELSEQTDSAPVRGDEPGPAVGGDAEPELDDGAVEAEDAGATGAMDADTADADDDVPAGAVEDEGVGVPIEEPSPPQVPDVSAQEPEQAIATVAVLPPAESQAALRGVSAAASRSVAAKRNELTANPPELDRPSGAPTEAERTTEERQLPPTLGAPLRVERTPAGATPPPVQTGPLPAAPAEPTQAARAPVVPGGPQGEMTEDGARELRTSIRSLPTTDPGLGLRAGPAPALELQGTADPQRMRDQRLRLAESTESAQAEGRRDVAQPMGETQLYPLVPPERLRAAITAEAARRGASPAGAVPAPPGAVGGAEAPTTDRAVSIVAQQQQGESLRATAVKARADMAIEREQHQTKVDDERARADAEVADLVQANAADQTAERKGARLEVHRRRVEWVDGQRQATERARTDADSATRTAEDNIEREQSTAETEAQTHIEQGDRDADAARREGEENARKERERGEQETQSEGFFGWLAKKATDFFDAIKEGITRAFEAARAVVRAAIQKAKELAVAAIERARTTIVAVIRRAGDLLIAAGDRLLADFPGLRDRFRAAINDRVEKAVARVNQLADGLKEGVQKALDLLGAALDAALGLLEKGLLFVVDVYAQAVQGAIKAAQAVVRAFGVFAVLIRDIAADPLRWLSNLGKSAKDGVRNHLWKAFKREIKRWFNEKLEEVLGLGLTLWRVLKKGGISIAKVGAMVWEGLKQVIPVTLIQILIEKLIAMIIPAAGAILLIIEGLQAAWGTVQRVLQAFERFFTFLKAVKTGRGGPQFANAVAAAVIVVIDFVANWLLRRLRKPAGKLAKAIRALAQKIGKKVAKGLKRLGKKLFKPRRGGRRKTKRARQDKRAKAHRRVDKALAFLERQLVRGLPYVILRAQMLYARGIYRVRIRLRDRWNSADLVVEASPGKGKRLQKKAPAKKPIDPKKYRDRAEAYLGWMVQHHDVHHIFGKEATLARWWDALGIPFNAPRLMLLLPPFLHQSGVHKGYRKLQKGISIDRQLDMVKRLEFDWNGVWKVWWAAKARDLGVQNAGQLRTRTQHHARVTQDVHAQARLMISTFSGSPFVRANLNQFRVDLPDGARKFVGRYRTKLEDYIKKLKRRKPPLKASDIRKLVSGWVRGRVTPLSKGAKTKTKELLYFLTGKGG